MSEVLKLAKRLVELLEKGNNEDNVQLGDLKKGETFVTDIGVFKVLDQTAAGTKVIIKDLFCENEKFDEDTPDYKESHIRELCDGEIYEAFAKVFGEENIVEHEVALTTVDMQEDYGTLLCKVRPLTFDEAREYNDLLVNKDLPDWCWTCTPWSTKERGWKYSVAVVSPSGIFDGNFYLSINGVRPVCILKSNIFVSKED